MVFFSCSLCLNPFISILQTYTEIYIKCTCENNFYFDSGVGYDAPTLKRLYGDYSFMGWRKTSSDPPCTMSSTRRHLSRTTDFLT